MLRNTTKLDTLVRHMEHVDYLKTDVQGAESMVLSGATETLERATYVQFEVSVIDYNQGGVCWYDVGGLLRKHGFFFYDSADNCRIPHAFRTKAIGQFNALYVKPSSPHLPKWLSDHNASFCGSGKHQKDEGAENAIRAMQMMSTRRLVLITTEALP